MKKKNVLFFNYEQTKPKVILIYALKLIKWPVKGSLTIQLAYANAHDLYKMSKTLLQQQQQ